MKLKVTRDNTTEHAPVNPIVTYELIVDMGEDGTKTVLSTDNYAETLVAIDEINAGDYHRVDITEEELAEVVGVSVNVVLTATELSIVKFDGEESAMAELQVYEVEK